MWRSFIFFFVIPLVGLLNSVSFAQNNRIDNETPYIVIPVSVERDQTTLTIDMRATSGDLDTLLYLVDSNGVILAENDDRIPRSDTNSLIVYPNAPAGTYQVVATRYGVLRDGTSGEFELEITQSTTQQQLDYSNISLEGFPQITPRPKATWTILAYYGADTNLEGAILNDFDEFEQAGGSDETVRIVVLVDRHQQYDESNDNWTTARLYEVNPDASGDYVNGFMPPTATLDTSPLVEIAELDTASGDVLTQFLLWGIQNYPADHYALAFGGHGAGWEGIVTDDDPTRDIITMPELRATLNTVLNTTGIERFDLLINDACSMSSVEYFQTVSPYFELAYASPEIVVDPALNMTEFVNALKADPNTDLISLGSSLIQTYLERDVQLRPGTDRAYMTHAVTDLQRFDPVVEAVEAFAALINTDPIGYSTLLGLARTNTYTYTRALHREADTLVDLSSFMQQVIALSTDVEVIRAARAVLQALDEARQYAEAGERAAPYVGYYNIYFPPDRSKFDTRYLIDSGLTAWGQMLRNYYNSVDPTPWLPADSTLTYHPPITPDVKVTRVYPDVASTASPPVAHIQVVGRRLSQGAFIVDRRMEDGRLVRLVNTDILTEVLRNGEPDLVNRWRSGVDLSYFSWLPMSLPTVTDGQVSYNELLYRSGNLATLNGRYQIGDDWQDVAVVFNTDGTFASVVSRDPSTGALAAIDIPDGTVFQSYMAVVQADGSVKFEPGNTYTWTREHRLTWQETPTPAGEYQLGFLVITFGGLIGHDSVTITVEESTNPGYTDLELGLTFEHPAGWSPVFDLGDRLITQGEGANIVVYYYPSQDDSITTLMQELNTRYDLTLEIADDGTFAEGKAIYHAGRWLVFMADEDTARELLLESIQLFEPPATNADWGYNFITPLSAYPVPVNWESTLDNIWTVWQPEASNGNTFIAVARLPKDFNVDAPDSSVALDVLLQTYAPDVDVIRQPYIGEFHRWQSAAYTVDRNGTTVIGRIYVTRRNGRYFAFRFETPDNDEALSIIRNIFEPMIDGFAPPPAQIFSVGGLDDTYIRAAISIAADICHNAAVNTVCYAEGNVSVVGADGFEQAGDTAPTALVEQVETQANSTAIIKAGEINITVLSNTRVINNAITPPDALSTLDVINNTDVRINVRAEPNETGQILGSLTPGERVQALAQNPAGDWILVQFNEQQTGWVFAELLRSDAGEINHLRMTEHNTLFDPMRSIDVELTPDSYGLLLRVPYDKPAQTIEINGALFEIAPGSLFYWRENLEELGVSVAAEGTLKRRPASWQADVVRGSVRVSVINPLTNLREVITSIGGTSIKSGSGDTVLRLAQTVTTPPVSVSDVPDIVDQAEFDALMEQQDQFTDVDFNLLDDEAYYFNTFGFADDDADIDGDGWFDWEDNCPYTFNPYQYDEDEDGIGNACDVNPDEFDEYAGNLWDDSDGDGWLDWEDNCPYDYNPDQTDTDLNGIGDLCDFGEEGDSDGDGWFDWEDNCPYDYNP
ncbi:MAG: hypothetical protein D6711_02165, partial [Chloroflexi bacterium]